jgi:hypothetical protein
MSSFIGIDVSSKSLDVAFSKNSPVQSFSNDDKGINLIIPEVSPQS